MHEQRALQHRSRHHRLHGADRDANRVVSFFQFLQEEGQATSPAYGRARPPDKPVYTRAQITRLYSQHLRAAYAGREAEWARQEADIAAGREGRVIGGVDMGGK